MSYSILTHGEVTKIIPNINKNLNKTYKNKLRRSRSSRLKEVKTTDVESIKNLPLPEGIQSSKLYNLYSFMIFKALWEFHYLENHRNFSIHQHFMRTD